MGASCHPCGVTRVPYRFLSQTKGMPGAELTSGTEFQLNPSEEEGPMVRSTWDSDIEGITPAGLLHRSAVSANTQPQIFSLFSINF